MDVLIQQVELFSGFEADGFAGSDRDFGAGARVAAYPGLAGFYGKYAKTAQFNAIAVSKGILHGLEDCVYSRFRLGTRKTCAFYYALDEVLLDQAGSPFFFPNTAVKTVSQLPVTSTVEPLKGAVRGSDVRPSPMVERAISIVNAA